ncbi:MAG: hypothetical protein SF029_04980 [bacterium]|nr:hypothetical protein [bacterium]
MRKFLILLLVGSVLAGCSLGSPSREDSGEEPIEQTEAATAPPIDLTTAATATNTRSSFITRTPQGTPAPTRSGNPTSLPLPGTRPANAATQPPAASGGGSGIGIGNAPAPISVSPVTSAQGFGLTFDGSIASQGISLFTNVTTYNFDQNPANPRQFAVIDQTGLLYITDVGGANAFRIEQGPYTQFPAADRATNNAAAEIVRWSPSGQYVAFIVDGNQQASDGVWYFQPGQFAPLQLIVDCPTEGFPGCLITTPPDNIRRWESEDIAWSPDGQALLVTATLPEQGHGGLMVIGVTRNERVRDNRPPMILYDYGSWGADGRILASGRNPDGLIEVAWLDRSGSVMQRLYQGGTLWLGWAVQQPNNQIVALGRQGDANGPLAIYDMNGTALTAPIGDAFPSRVLWSPDRSAVYVEAGGRRYVASVGGQVTEITSQSGPLAVNWVR